MVNIKSHVYILAVLLVVAGSSPAAAERLTVAADVANIRSGPGTKFDILWKVGKFHPLNVLEKSGSWYRFRDFEGDEGWVHKSLISNLPSIITIKEKCHVRSGPGTGSDILFSVENGIPFQVIKRKGNWIHIRHADGDQGWIHNSLVW
jgi:SH3-like domain-containing protein